MSYLVVVIPLLLCRMQFEDENNTDFTDVMPYMYLFCTSSCDNA